ncbi:uncharacterized protein LOC117180581 [Belonocnema kinseyi]|uniref:uncharacterized protein LOC117180581 n=1 Tax=Belonocnema kinseyi TaxID=2817044 RepID=UPI00143E0C49|nr:uncharacterized protein LOC117180581 [Belonocnema kinseyi]
MEQLLEFLHRRERILESNKPLVEKRIEENVPRCDNKLHNGNQPTRSQPTFQRQSAYAVHTRRYCYICKESHFTQNCEKLLSSNLQDRWNLIKSLNLCYNCLRSNDTVENCNATACKTCSQKHNTVLHPENKNKKCFQTNHASLHNSLPSQVLLSTARINILDNKGVPHACRALLDNGSQVHFMTEKLAEKLGLKQREIEIPLGGVNQMTSSVSKITRTTIQSRLNKYSTYLTFLITPEVNNQAPSEPLDRVELKIPSNIRLAAPEFHRPSEIDILIGAEIFLKLLCVGQMSLANGNVIIQKTHFGWILGGKTPGVAGPIAAKCNLSFNLLNKKICEFWEIENGPNERTKSHEDSACEIHFQENTRRDSATGRYIVKLPFKEDSNGLGESYSHALKRFHSLERSLGRNPELKDKYITFMSEYSELDHMSEDQSASIYDGYFLPHHAIIKQSSLTTKLRTVFDASAKTSNGNSLNDILMVGPNIQEDLFSLLIRFRSHIFAITADIEKMYRQILVNENDQKFRKILWRENSHQPVKIFRLKTVTYGTSSASFLATRTLVQLAYDECGSYSCASVALRQDFYMDHLISGARTIEEAKQLFAELMTVTRKGGMNLKKWVSNVPELIRSLSKDFSDTYFSLDLGDTTKALGVYWNPDPDSFFYTVKQSRLDAPVTKRNILSEIAELFDPLGLLGPVVLTPKIFMQNLWQLNIGWDESVPPEIEESWLDLKQNLALLREIEINRKIVVDNYVSLQMHGYCDASEKAFGACIYVRSTDKRGMHFTQLVCSKSRVVPLQTLSLPHLELSAAVLLSKLYSTVSQALRRLHIEKTIFWCDSTITLHWINSPPNTLKPFVGNRVAEIQSLTQSLEWRHVRTEHNPADLVSRGLAPQQLINNSFWFNGPAWINDAEQNWPVSHLEPIEIPELKKNSCQFGSQTSTRERYHYFVFREDSVF